MTSQGKFLKKLGVLFCCLLTLIVTFRFYANDAHLFFIGLVSMSLIAFINKDERHLYPTLLIVFLIRVLEFLFSTFLIKSYALTYLLMTGLVDLFFAFLLVHYSQESFLVKFCRTKDFGFAIPQIHWIAFILGVSCFYRVAAGVELMIHELDRSFFQGEIPFFFSTGPTAMLIMRLAIDTLLWSMLLFPRKLAHFRVTPPPQATPD